MKRQWALLAAMLLMLTGCADTDGDLVMPEVPSRQLTLAIYSEVDEETTETLAVFAQAVERLSQGELSIGVIYESDPLDSLGKGSCELAQVSLKEVAGADDRLAMTVQPFFWHSYEHFTAALNSPDNLALAGELLSESISARPLGVYYQDTVNLMSTRKVYDHRGLSTFNMAIKPGEWASYDVFTPQVDTIRYYVDRPSLYTMLREKEVRLVEADREMAAYLGEKFSRIYAVATEQYIGGDWLLLADSALQSLTPRQQAVLTQAMAESLADNDVRYRELDRAVWSGEEDPSIIPIEGPFERLRATGEYELGDKIISQNDWSPELLSAYRMGFSLATSLPPSEEDEEEEDEDEEQDSEEDLLQEPPVEESSLEEPSEPETSQQEPAEEESSEESADELS